MLSAACTTGRGAGLGPEKPSRLQRHAGRAATGSSAAARTAARLAAPDWMSFLESLSPPERLVCGVEGWMLGAPCKSLGMDDRSRP